MGIVMIAALLLRVAEPTSTLRSEALGSVRAPDRVESLAARDLAETPDPSLVPTESDLPGKFAILPGATPVEPKLAAELSRLVLDPASYDKVVSACFFEPVVAFRFWKAGKAVDVLVCFHCGELGFQAVGAPKAIGGTLSFGPARARLLALVTAARPTDARLRGIR